MALLGGHIDVAVLTPSSALAQLQNGDVRLLGISSNGRDQYFPEVPTFKEQGFNVVETIWRSVMLKAGTPQPVIDTLISSIDKMKQTREWKDFSRLNLQSSIEISLPDMQNMVAKEIASDRAFLESSGFLK
jgi:tripartite-type tricarboxylate transporter receptor subunit TctC